MTDTFAVRCGYRLQRHRNRGDGGLTERGLAGTGGRSTLVAGLTTVGIAEAAIGEET